MVQIWTRKIIILCSGILLLLGGCAKDGTAIDETLDTEINFLAVTIDTIRLGVRIDGESLVNDLLAPTATPRLVPIRYYNKEKKITLYNVADNRVLFDSSFKIHTGNLTISLYQKNSGDPLSYIAPPASETLPPENYGKISFVYTFPALPDIVKVVVQNSIDNSVNYAPTDSFQLKKGEFSRFFLSRSTFRKADVYLYTPGADRKLVGMINRGEYSDMNAGLTIYSVRSSSSYVNGVYELVQQKLY